MGFDPFQKFRGWLKPILRRHLNRILVHQYTYVGDPQRLSIAPTAVVNNAFFNVHSGTVIVKDYAFFGFHVSVLAASHDYTKFGQARMEAVPTSGRDVVIESGAWIGTNVTIIGPCVIGEHAVVAAGAVVTKDVAPHTIVAGIPARLMKTIHGQA